VGENQPATILKPIYQGPVLRANLTSVLGSVTGLVDHPEADAPSIRHDGGADRLLVHSGLEVGRDLTYLSPGFGRLGQALVCTIKIDKRSGHPPSENAHVTFGNTNWFHHEIAHAAAIAPEALLCGY